MHKRNIHLELRLQSSVSIRNTRKDHSQERRWQCEATHLENEKTDARGDYEEGGVSSGCGLGTCLSVVGHDRRGPERRLRRGPVRLRRRVLGEQRLLARHSQFVAAIRTIITNCTSCNGCSSMQAQHNE
ncbi:hypothetical protein Y032_0046g1321 [Ancylostoma ceylanicum]|uniref:Uncharacterized protein n=1 Tax=Ancylostoma ceylanicum TaxID=53326 RepID=A0A016UBT6_9BILA|nr:hypothetical protein Y032_0046g1321 [Ancylostoma ceylanicum]